MGLGGDPGRRATQTGGHVCKGNTDPHHRKIHIHRQGRPQMAAERFRFIQLAGDARLEERADGARLVWQAERAARAG